MIKISFWNFFYERSLTVYPFKNRRPNVSCAENSDERIKVLNKRVLCDLFRTVRNYTIFFKESFNITSILKNSMITILFETFIA